MEGNTIDHFLDRHPLKLIEEEVNHKLFCRGCDKSLSLGPSYGCSRCKFYLHKACAELQLPKEIQNFFHPCPLSLGISYFVTCNACFGFMSGFSFCYRCKGCVNFYMHVECAQRPNIKSNGDRDGDGDSEEIIQHFTHWHPLRLVDEKRKKDLQVGYCGICGKLICFDSGFAAYRCEECKFFLHKSCMIINIPRKINNHFFHPSCSLILLTTPITPIKFTSFYRCNGCGDNHASGLVFYCGKCDFELDVKCALLPTLDQSKDADKIQYFGHKHPLLALRYNKEDNIIASEVNRCGACGEKCFSELDEDPCFGCKRCDLFLHKSCMMNIPQQINSHFFHPSCPLTLLTPPSSYRCAGCDDEHVSRLAYSCEKCGFQLDVKCALLPTLDQSKDADKIQHVAHKHPLLALPHNKRHNNIIDRCGVCGEKCPSESCLSCERCRFYIHRRCAIGYTVKAEMNHYFHPLHHLTLSSPPTVESSTAPKCGACLASIDEFLLLYRCAKCKFNLHVDCAKAKRQLLVKHEGHPHHLTFFDNTRVATSCHNCHTVARNCILRCVACNFNIHLFCHPSAPNTIKHKCHLHPLTLTESPFQYELISPEYQEKASESDDEFYCDVCEEKRDKYESVYYCAECKRIAETRCVISELLPLVIGSEGHGRVVSTDEKNSALEDSIAKRTIEMEKLTVEKKPLELEIAKLKALEEKLKSINQKLEEIERDRVLWKYQLNFNKEKSNSSGASTSEELAADLSLMSIFGKLMLPNWLWHAIGDSRRKT